MSAEIVESVDVAAAPEVVFAAMTDWEHQGEWMALTAVRAVHSAGRDVGEQIAARTGVGPFGFTDRMTITQWDPPRQVRVRHDGWPIRGTAAFTVTPRPDGTATFTWSERLDLPLGVLGRATFELGRPVFLLFLRRSLDRFATWAPRHG